MAPKYDNGNPKWLNEQNENKRNMVAGEGAPSFTVDTPQTQYESRSDDPTLKRPT